jgi:hypothetical protein
MFLSKIFGIFKKKKTNPEEGSPSGSTPSGAVVLPSSGGVGAGVGLSQPDQSAQPPSSDQLAQAAPEPSFTPPSPPASPQPSDTVAFAPDTPQTDSPAESDGLGSLGIPSNPDQSAGSDTLSPPSPDNNPSQPGPTSDSDAPAAGMDISAAPTPPAPAGEDSAPTLDNDDNQNIAV